ncbi:hypothetical protein ACWDZ4_21680 [Streptomyces sp. NPDC003016]
MHPVRTVWRTAWEWRAPDARGAVYGAPRLDRALKKVARQGGEVVLIDGTLIPTQRRTGKADRRNYSGCDDGRVASAVA